MRMQLTFLYVGYMPKCTIQQYKYLQIMYTIILLNPVKNNDYLYKKE